MRIQDHLDKGTKSKLRNLSMPKGKRNNKSKTSNRPEQLSERDLNDLMGVHRDRYERRGGAVRRK